VKNIGGADSACERRKAVCTKARPLLSFEIERPNVDVARRVDVDSTADRIFKVRRSSRIRVAPGLQSEVANAEERLAIKFETLFANDIAGTENVGVFADVAGCIYGIVNDSFDSNGMGEVDVTEKRDAFNIGLTEVGIGTCSTDT